MIRQDLGGDNWQFRRARNWDAWLNATVPGCVHTDLLAAGLIDDPFVGLRELDVLWIDSADWEYRRTFDVAANVLKHTSQQLVFEGLDTIAEVLLNGQSLGRADNMFRRWTFDATGLLKPAGNELLVRFTGPVAEGQRLSRKHGELPGGVYSWGTGRQRLTGRNYVRKAQYQFGWDWGPSLATCGIWREVALVAGSGPRIEHVCQRQKHAGGAVTVTVDVHLTSPARGKAVVRAKLGGVEQSVPVLVARGETKATLHLRIERPKLWWPAGEGKQHLYDLKVELTDEAGNVTDAARRKVGLRKVELVRKKDKIGESFLLKVNGRKIYCKGANWIPADIFPTRVDRGQYEYLLTQAVGANMNMLRIWGGGIYEHDDFYDLCDRLGLMVWHDHMFACASYPADKAFLDNVSREVRHQVRRLSCHPSIVLWCGNNENEQAHADWYARNKNIESLRRDYLKLTRAEEKVTRAEAPDLPWWPSSASSGGNLQDPNSTDRGDCHFWEVWHKRAPFSRYLEIKPRFQSEFGFQSFPDAATLRPVIDRTQWDLSSPQMEHHQRSGVGNSVICETLTRSFRMPPKLEDFFYVSQLVQAMAIQMGVQHWRRIKPICWGTIYWQINDCWPVASWSSIDSAGRLKALHHFARRFFDPLLVSAIETGGKIDLYVTSDLQKKVAGRWTVEAWNFDGRLEETLDGKFSVAANSSKRVAGWAASRFADGFDRRNQVFLRLTAETGGREVENFLLLGEPKRADLAPPNITVNVRKAGDALEVKLTSDAVALFVECRTGDVQGDWSVNFVHLLPGRPRKLTFRPRGRTSAAALQKALKIRSLRDTY